MDEFVAEQIGKWEVSPQLAKVFRDGRSTMVPDGEYQLFNAYVTRVTYSADTDDVGMKLSREAAARFQEQRVERGSIDPDHLRLARCNALVFEA